MKVPNLFSSAALLGAVSISLAGAPRSSGQTLSKPKATTIHPVSTTVVPITSDTPSTTTTSAATDPVGFTSLSLPANSDSLISIPFTRAAAFSGTISSISGNTITVAASPAWTTNQYVYAAGTQPNTYYAIIGPNFNGVTGTVIATNGSKTVTGSGSTFTSQIAAGDELVINGNVAQVASVNSATSLTLVSTFIGATTSGTAATYDHSPKEGSYYTVTANGTNTLTVNLNGDSLSSVAGNLGNTTVTLIPYWTLGTAFPASDSGTSFAPSTSSKSRGTQILLPDMASPGVNLAATSTYYFLNNHWQLAADTSGLIHDDDILVPTSYFVVRNSASQTTFMPTGSVYMNRISTPLDSQTNTAQDNAVALPRPTNVTLNDLGLISSGAFTPGTSSKNRGDLLLTYDNTATAVNKAAGDTYYNVNGQWYKAADTTGADVGSTMIPYGVGLTIRKAATTSGATTFWQNNRNY